MLAVPNLSDKGMSEPKDSPNGLLAKSAMAKLLYLLKILFGESSPVVTAAPWNFLGMSLPSMAFTCAVPALAFAVLHVVNLSSKEQMRGVHTQPIVATVKNLHVFGDGSEVENPRTAMRADQSCTLRAKSYLAVSAMIYGCGPVPAFSRRSLGDFFPKAMGESFRQDFFHGASIRATGVLINSN